MDNTKQQVCILIDFENLIYGLSNLYNEDELMDKVDIDVLFSLAEEYGSVVLANAYGDWRNRQLNQFQLDLYKSGVELVHVLARGRKNAVDVKMAVDAIEMIWRYPEINTFVIVSGDRDFIPVLKTLRRHGKSVVGIAPAQSTSADFAALCDRFLRYAALLSTYSAGQPPLLDSTSPASAGIEDVKRALRKVLADHAEEGLKGAKIKPLLRRELAQTFDESEYGFSKMSQFLRAMPDVVRIEAPALGGDITAFPASTAAPPARAGAPEAAEGDGDTIRLADELIQASGIRFYRFEQNVQRRRKILEHIHRPMVGKESFAWQDLCEEILETVQDVNLSITVLSRYHSVLWQSYSFDVLPGQDVPVKQKRVRLKEPLHELAAICRHYEESIAYKVVTKVNRRVRPEVLCDLLGLAQNDASTEYCEGILRSVNARYSR
ncbi:MAG: NYN domain-containing protein [Anaerolineae bacterium]